MKLHLIKSFCLPLLTYCVGAMICGIWLRSDCDLRCSVVLGQWFAVFQHWFVVLLEWFAVFQDWFGYLAAFWLWFAVFCGLGIVICGTPVQTSTCGLPGVICGLPGLICGVWLCSDQGWAQGSFVEAEARQTKFEARPRRGDPWKILLPLDV